jgi:5'-methylthioadenosine phosphorylase
MSDTSIGVIGGSGLYTMDGVTDLEEFEIDTPFGKPSDAVIVGKLDGISVAFLPRHGRKHLIPPHQINYRANIWALKSLGVRWLMSVSAVGSLREGVEPGQLVMVDQFIDRTRTRPSTFFEDGVAAHVSFADPCCEVLRQALLKSAADANLPHHDGGTYVCIEGPQFSTRAESNLYRSWGADVVGMTNLPECRLAREAQMAYSTIAMATDYDCWHEGEDEVSVEAVVAVLKANVNRAKTLLKQVIPTISALGTSPAFSALHHAVMTADGAMDEATRKRVGLFLEDTRYHGE